MTDLEYDFGSKGLTDRILENLPTKAELILVDALLFAVYGWSPNKIRKLNLNSLNRWIEYAKKKMTWGDAYKLLSLLEPRKRSLWQKIKSKIRF